MPFDENKIDLSVLILTIPSRLFVMKILFDKLERQCLKHGQRVEILCFLDNKSKHIADKRNDLLSAAQGKYLCYLDDDDDISNDYIDSILEAIDMSKDVDIITFDQQCSINGKSMVVNFRMNNPTEQLSYNPDGTLKDLLRPPFHMCVFKSSIAKSETFRRVYTEGSGQSREDHDWTERLYPKIQSEHHIDKKLHHYIFSSKGTESVLR